MDRVLLPSKDVIMLGHWLEEHRDLVRALPAPFRAIEIVFQGTLFRVKYIRENDMLTLHVIYKDIKRGKIELKEMPGEGFVEVKDTTHLKREMKDFIIVPYAALMAFMVYEKPELVEPPAEPIKKHEKRGKGTKKQKTYILRCRVVQVVSRGGHHASPKGIFTVRGHYRHLRDGRTIWIAEYKKGTGDKKSKTYKLGAMKNDDAISSGAKADAVV